MTDPLRLAGNWLEIDLSNELVEFTFLCRGNERLLLFTVNTQDAERNLK